eukprot:scpid52167/ scgid23036/ 
MALSLLLRRLYPRPSVSSCLSGTRHCSLTTVDNSGQRTADLLESPELKDGSPEKVLKLIAEQHKTDSLLGRSLAVDVAKSLTEDRIRRFSPENVVTLIAASWRGKPHHYPHERRAALSHIASLCTPSTVKKWSDAGVVQVTAALLRQRVSSTECSHLVKDCSRMAEDKLFVMDRDTMVTVAEVLSVSRKQERGSSRLLNIINDWSKMETPVLTLEQKFRIIAHCLSGGVFPVLLSEVLHGFNVEDTRRSVVYTKEMLMKVEPSALALMCRTFVEQRRKVPHIPLPDYLIDMYPTIMDKHDMLSILECCTLSELFTAAQAKQVAVLVEEDIAIIPKHLYNQLFRALSTRCPVAKKPLSRVQRKVFDVAVEQTMDSKFGATLLMHACSRGWDISDALVAELVSSTLASKMTSLSQVARVLRALSFRYRTSAPEDLLSVALSALQAHTINMHNCMDAVQCIRGLASLNCQQKDFVDQVALFFEQNMDSILRQNGLESISLLAVSLATLVYRNVCLARVMGDVADAAAEHRLNEYVREQQWSEMQPMFEDRDLHRMVNERRVRKHVPNTEVMRILGFCYLNKVYPHHASLAVSKFQPSDVKPFMRTDVERAFVWTLAPALSAVTQGQLRTMPDVLERFFKLSKHLWPVPSEFVETVGNALLEYCSDDSDCIQHYILTQHDARIHFTLLASSADNSMKSWSQHRIKPAYCNAKQLRHSGFDPIAIICVDGAAAEHNAVPILSELQRLSLALAGWRAVVLDRSAWPADSASVQDYIKQQLARAPPQSDTLKSAGGDSEV